MSPSNAPSLRPWSIQAVNLPEHADNPVHTVEGARAAGYDGAVVAGTTVYAYMTRPAADGWGTEWVTSGTASVRFVAPVLADEPIDLVPVRSDGRGDDRWRVEARGADAVRATCEVGLGHVAPLEPEGERLDPLVETLGERWAGYADRAGEDLPLYAAHDLVHPVVWLSLANRVFSTQLVDGAWVHTRSEVRHLGGAAPGDIAVVEAWVVDRFSTRSGDRAVVDVRVTVDGRPVAAIEHEAIVRLTAADSSGS